MSGEQFQRGIRPLGTLIPVEEIGRLGGNVGSGKQPGERPLTLLPGVTPLGEPIVRATRQPGEKRPSEQVQSTLREEINAFLDKRAQLRAEGQLTRSADAPPIITPADAISFDLQAHKFELDIRNHPENTAKCRSVDRIHWGFQALAFGRMSQDYREEVTLGHEFGQGFFRNHPQLLEDTGRLNGEETAILAQLLHKVGILFDPLPSGMTIPYAPTVAKMREIVGGEPLWEIPAPGEVPDSIDRYR